MIVSIKGADFSADNLGKVTIPRNLRAFTTAAILASGKTDLTESQKYALDDFFRAIGAGEVGDTIASRLKYLFIPIIAGDLSKALINYKDAGFNVEGTPNSAQWALNEKGLYGLNATSTSAITFTLDTPLLQDNVSMLFFRGDIMPDTNPGNQHYLSIRGKTNTSKWLSMYQYQNTSNEGHFTTGGLPSQWVTGGYDETYPTINGYNLTSSPKKIIGGVASAVTAPSVDMSTELQQTIYAFGMSSKNTIPTAFAMLGQGLSESELTAVLTSLELLRDAFLRS